MPTTTKHNRLVKPDPSESGKTTSYNTDLDALEKGYHVQGTAGGAVAQFDALSYDAATNRWRRALDAEVRLRGICQVTAADAALTYVQVQGIATNTGWTWTAGQEIFISAATAGLLTATAPFATSRPIGVAISATEIVLYNVEHLERLRRGLKWEIGKTLTVVGTDANVFQQHVELYNAGGQCLVVLAHSRGAEGVHSALLSGDLIGSFMFRGSDGTAFQNAGFVRCTVTENWSATARGNKISLWTVPNGQTGAIERLLIDENGGVAVGVINISPVAKSIHVMNEAAASIVITQAAGSDQGSSRPLWFSRRSRGTLSAQTAVLLNDSLAEYIFQAHDGTSQAEACELVIEAAENWSATAHGSRVSLKRSRVGQIVRDIALQIGETVADGETAILIQRNAAGVFSLQRVSMGPDNGLPGAGFRGLRVPV